MSPKKNPQVIPSEEIKSEKIDFSRYNLSKNVANIDYYDLHLRNLFSHINPVDFQFHNLINNLPRTSKSLSETAVKNLKAAHSEGNLCLVLGAGVSFNHKIPTWDSLLQRLLMRTIEKETDRAHDLAKLFSKVFNPSPLIAGRYLQEMYRDPKKKNKFEDEVRNALYETFDENANSPVIDEIIRFCLAPGNTPNLDSIITYNYDDIIETKLNEKEMEMPFQTVFGQSMDTSLNDLKIFHVHGYLPRKGPLDDQNNITMGEHVYHEQYSNIYSWNNIVQINKFRDKTCLFIGVSLSDPNIRRLLDIANTQKKHIKYHYIFKKKIKKESVIERLQKLSINFSEDFNGKVQSELMDDTINFLIASKRKIRNHLASKLYGWMTMI